MSKSTFPYPHLSASATGTGLVSHAGAILLLRTAEKTGLTTALTTELGPFRKPLARHDPGKIVLDLAVSLALGGDCLADIAQLRAHPEIFGAVASDPTVSRLISRLAADTDTALAAIDRARATARSHAWAAAGTSAPDHAIDEAHPLVLDIDATLVTAHSEKERAAPTFKRGFGFHPLCAFVDHGEHGTGEPVAMLLRPGNAGSNTAADHVTVVQDALAQLPFDPTYRVGKKVLVRIDGAGGTHSLIEYLTKRRLSYSVGFSLTDTMGQRPRSGPGAGLDPGLRFRWAGPRRGLGHRDHRPARPVHMAERHARDRPQGAPASGCAVAIHRPRRPTPDRVRDEHPPRATPRSGAAAPATGPVRGPDPSSESHRSAESSVARFRSKPDLAGARATRMRAARVDADARVDRGSGAAVGTETAAAAVAVDRGEDRPACPPCSSATGCDSSGCRSSRGRPEPARSATCACVTCMYQFHRDERTRFPGPWTSASPDRVGQSTVDTHRIHGLHIQSEDPQAGTRNSRKIEAKVPVPGDPVARPDRHRTETMDNAVETSTQRIRHHLRRPHAGQRGQLTENATYTVNLILPRRETRRRACWFG